MSGCWKKTGIFDMLIYMEKKAAVTRLVIFIIGFFILKTCVMDIGRVSGSSMEPALAGGQLVVIWKLAYGIPLPAGNRYVCRWRVPEAGDIVLYAMNGRSVVKRCVKTGGSMLHFTAASQPASGSYALLQLDAGTVPLNRIQFKNLGGFLPAGSQKIPAGFILALGDNAAQSYDSRDYGFVSIDSIRGKLLCR